jgi:NitT/TauT family transport system substrate-binding protein
VDQHRVGVLVKRWITVLLLLALAVVLMTSCGSGEQAGDQEPWQHGIVIPKGDAGYIMMAQEQGFYQEHGAEVEVVELEGAVQLAQGLLAGELDSAELSPDPIYEAALRGADLKIIGSTIPGMAYALYSSEEIGGLEELPGRTLGTSAPGALPDVIARAMLRESGIDPESVQLTNAGSDADRWQALLGGQIDAVANSAEYVPETEEDDRVKVLAQAWEVVPQYPRFMIVANNDALEERPEAAVGFLAGTMDGISYALENREDALQLTADTTDAPVDDLSSVYMYDLIKEQDFASPTSEISRDNLEWLHDFRLEAGIQDEEVNLDELIDESYREQALEEANVQQ